MTEPLNNKAILVLGMHRSGTSAIAGVLSKLGVDFSDNLLPGIAGINDKGFFEHTDIIDLNEELLGQMGRTWLDLDAMPPGWAQSDGAGEISGRLTEVLGRDFRGQQMWGLKDPRLCRLLPLWTSLLAELQVNGKAVLCLRHPLEVAESLVRRDKLDRTLALMLWFLHVLESERYSRDMSRSVLIYDDLLSDWRGECARLAEELSVSWPVEPQAAAIEIDEFLEHSLKHATAVDSSAEDDLAKLAIRLYDDICQRKSCDAAVFAEVEREYQQLVAGLQPYLALLNTAQLAMFQSSALQRDLVTEQDNAREQIQYRDKVIEEVWAQLADEKKNSAQQIAYREALVEGLNEQLESERKNTVEQIEYREALLAEIRQQLTDEKQNARDQILYRDDIISNQSELLASRKHMLKSLIKLSLPSKS